MPISSHNLLETFRSQRLSFEEFRLKVESLVSTLLKNEGIKYHQISSRLKSEESLINKISKKEKYLKLEDITDIIGLRIVTFFDDDVDSVAEIIRNEFEIDTDNSIDKRNLDSINLI